MPVATLNTCSCRFIKGGGGGGVREGLGFRLVCVHCPDKEGPMSDDPLARRCGHLVFGGGHLEPSCSSKPRIP